VELQTIHQLFSDNIYRIPSYQRGYTWGNNKPVGKDLENPFKDVVGQLKDLWDDIQNTKEDSWHYIGLLTLVEANIKEYGWLKNHSQYNIVDGQQRITTILILLTVLIEKSKELNIKLGLRESDAEMKYLFIKEDDLYAHIFGYDKDNPSDEYFKRHIIKLDIIFENNAESIYTENLKKAKKFFDDAINLSLRKAINEKERAELLKKLFDKITTQLKFNVYRLPLELNEYVVFETMNNRGKPLSELEKLKNRLMYLNDKFKLDDYSVLESTSIDADNLLKTRKDDLKDNINKAWITIYRSLGANKINPLDDEEFVRNHWIIYFNEYDRSEAKVYKSFLFDNYFSINRLYSKELEASDIHEYALSLQKSAIEWNKLRNPEFIDNKEIKNLILRLHYVGLRPSFQPLILAILLKENSIDYSKVLNLLEEYAFKLFYIADRQSNTGDSKLYRLAFKVYNENSSPDDAYNEIKEHLEYYYRFDLFKGNVKELFLSGNKNGYYGWSGIFYFLFEYDKYWRSENQTTEKDNEIDWEDFRSKNSIEHIFPHVATLSFEEYIKDSKNKDLENLKIKYEDIQNRWSAFRNVSYENRKLLSNSLGNLLALNQTLNASLQADSFINKVDQKNKGVKTIFKGYKYDSMSARIVADEPDWTPESIKNRGMKMLDHLWDMLHPGQDIKLTENEKLELLGLDFMIK